MFEAGCHWDGAEILGQGNRLDVYFLFYDGRGIGGKPIVDFGGKMRDFGVEALDLPSGLRCFAWILGVG